MSEEQRKHQQHLNRIIGQLQGIQKMMGENKECAQVINQIQAARASLASLGEALIADEAACCIDLPPAERDKTLRALVRNLFKLS